jgi:hypothetical protein
MTGRRWAYAGALLGGAVSIAANVAHSYVPPAGAPADWSPHLGAVVGAVFWPVALFVAIEILARVAWPDGRRWVVLRFGGLLPVAAVAAVVSYRHLSGLLAFYREDGLTVAVGPLAVDGLMVMATGALIATSRARAAAAAVDPPAATVPVKVAAVADVKPADDIETSAQLAEPAEQAPTEPPVQPPAKRPARRPSAADRVAKAARRTPTASPAQIAARLDLSERTVQRYMPAPADDTTTTREEPSEQVNNHHPDLAPTT